MANEYKTEQYRAERKAREIERRNQRRRRQREKLSDFAAAAEWRAMTEAAGR